MTKTIVHTFVAQKHLMESQLSDSSRINMWQVYHLYNNNEVTTVIGTGK